MPEGGGCAITILKPQPKVSYNTNGNNIANGNGIYHDTSSSDETDDSEEADSSASIISNGTKLKHKILDSLEVKLDNEGFQGFETTLAGDGVGVLWPAVLHNGNEEEGGEEIDQEKFLMAEGTEGIERLVGTQPGRKKVKHEVREGWRFWRPWESDV